MQAGQGLLVEAAALATEQLAGDRLARQGVTEAEHVGLVLQDDAAGDQLAEGVDQFVLVAARHRGEQVEGDALAEHGRGLDHAQLRRVEVVEPAQDGLGEVPRQRQVLELLRVGVAGGDQQLLEEERVATGASVHRLGDPERHRVPVDRGQQLGDGVLVQPVHGHLGDLALAPDVGERSDQLMPAVDRLRPEAADQQGAEARRQRQAAEQRDALGVGPVQVLEHQHPPAGADEQVLDQGDGRAEQLLLAVLAVGEGLQMAEDRPQQQPQRLLTVGEPLGHLPPCGDAGADRLQQQLERPRRHALTRLPGQHPRAHRQGCGQLAQQAGLADAGLAADQHHLGLVGGQRSLEARQLHAAPHHHRAQPGPAREHMSKRSSHLPARALAAGLGGAAGNRAGVRGRGTAAGA